MNLNPEQYAAVHDRGHCVVVACPGSGKTRVLIEKAAHILETEPLASLVIVTFTRDAAREVRSRLLLRLPGEVHRVRAETCHALAIRHCFEAGLFRQLVSPGQQASLLRRAWTHACPELAWEVFVRAVDWRASGHTAAPPSASFDDAYSHYLALLEQHAAVDFGQVIVQTVQRIRARQQPVSGENRPGAGLPPHHGRSSMSRMTAAFSAPATRTCGESAPRADWAAR